MKKLLLSAVLLGGAIVFTGCKKTCVECEATVLGIGSEVELCEDGDDLKITSKALGLESDTTITGTSLSDYQKTLETSGYTCK